MKLEGNQKYVITDAKKQFVGEISSVKQVENWYVASIKQLELSETLRLQFDEIEKLIKKHDFSHASQLEKEILGHNFEIQETGQKLCELQLGKRKKIYFKLS